MYVCRGACVRVWLYVCIYFHNICNVHSCMQACIDHACMHARICMNIVVYCCKPVRYQLAAHSTRAYSLSYWLLRNRIKKLYSWWSMKVSTVIIKSSRHWDIEASRRLKTSRHRDIDTSRHRDVSRHRDIETSWHRDVETSGYRNVETSKRRDIETFRYRDVEISTIETSRHRDVETSRRRDI